MYTKQQTESYSNSDSKNGPGVNINEPPTTLSLPPIIDREVENMLTHLKADRTPGPDHIGNEVLKQLSSSIVRPLTQLYNKILKNGIIAQQWKVAEIILLHKKHQ